jgi:hypothetical protein
MILIRQPGAVEGVVSHIAMLGLGNRCILRGSSVWRWSSPIRGMTEGPSGCGIVPAARVAGTLCASGNPNILVG